MESRMSSAGLAAARQRPAATIRSVEGQDFLFGRFVGAAFCKWA